MPKSEANLHKTVSSINSFKIRWCKKAKLSKDLKQKAKKDLYDLDSRKEVAEIRFSLQSIPHLKAYVTIEYCNDSWHIFMETYSFCIGEILREGGPFIQLLKKDEVEEEELL